MSSQSGVSSAVDKGSHPLVVLGSLCNRSIVNTSISCAFADLSGRLAQPESWSAWVRDWCVEGLVDLAAAPSWSLF